MIHNRYAKYANYAPAHKSDVLKLPAREGRAARDGHCGDRKRRGRKSAAIIMSAGLALLSAFIPMTAQEAKAATDPSYISGGGGGRGSGGGTPENNGSFIGSNIGNQAGPALVTQGGELIAGPGMAAAVREEYGLELFGIASTGRIHYDTSPRLDLSSTHLMTGLSRGWNIAHNRLTLGAFFEYGAGSYDSQAVFESGPIRADGNVRYIGGGVLGRMDFAENGRGRFYAEGSGRAGSVRNEFNSYGLSDFLGNNAKFASNSAYFSLHAGLGYLLNISERSMLDIYGKYFWTRIGGDSVYISAGEHIEFQDFNSHRLRIGGRFSHTVNESVKAYAGTAWEHEFDGRIRGSANGYSLGVSSLSGGTGIGELGLLITPSETMPLFIDLGIQGYTGKREGVTGRLEIRWEF